MASQIIEDLTHIPNIIAGLGLSIAEAQRHFDLDYLRSLERLIAMAQSMLGRRPDSAQGTAAGADDSKRLEQFQSVIKDFLLMLAPSRYQFTETTLSVKLDLAQHLDIAAGGGVSAGIGGVAINAAVSIGYGTDYRGAAECRTVLHAMPADQTMLRTLLDRAGALSVQGPAPTDRSAVDGAVTNQANNIFERLTGVKAAAPPASNAAPVNNSASGTATSAK